MRELIINRINQKKQYSASIMLVLLVSALCFGFSGYIGYRVVAFILLVTVSMIAITFDILPVLVAAALSAFIWDFFFISPRFTLHVASTDDTILLVMYFIIALINAVLTYKIRQVEKVARQKEEKANAVKLYNTLLNSLSHELRTPIAAIIGATDNLQENNQHLSTEHKKELVSEISTAAFRLNQQVENLLNMSRIESGFVQPKKDWCDITEVVYDVVRRLEENNIPQRVHISIKQGIPLFRLDKMMLEHILYNLLNNASLYTEPESIIQVSAVWHADVCQIIVEDNGKGFPEEEIGNVFDKFYRLKNAKANGTGLGLSIVKGFTEALGGIVLLENISTGGARFTVEIPGETSYLNT